MEYLLLKKNIVFALVIMGLTSCGEIDHHVEFHGDWNSTHCEEGANSRSYTQVLRVTEVTELRTIKVWNQANCPKGVTPTKYGILGISTDWHDSVSVGTICDNGKAVKRNMSLNRIAKDGVNLVEWPTEDKLSTDDVRYLQYEKKIRQIIVKEIGNVMPKYDLMCLDARGNIRTGDIETGDGSTDKKRPKEMDASQIFVKNK